MSEQTQETRAQRREREAAEALAAQTQPTGEQPTGEQPTEQPNGEQPTEPTEEQKAQAEAIARIGGYSVSDLQEFKQASTPVRQRNDLQKAMDAVAEKAYHDWTAAERPTIWAKMPVITYFLTPEEVAGYRKLIRKAAELVVPEPYEKDGETVTPNGVRARFGKEFTLTEKMAGKIGKPDQAGKTVLAWAAIDKRNVQGRDGDSDS